MIDYGWLSLTIGEHYWLFFGMVYNGWGWLIRVDYGSILLTIVYFSWKWFSMIENGWLLLTLNDID